MKSVSPLVAGLACRCPRCGEGRLFAGLLALAPACARCGLDFSSFDSGDGPAVFVIFLTGFIAVPLLVWLGVSSALPEWLLALIGAVVVIAMTLTMLRPAKALLVALEYRNKAREGREDRGEI